MNTKMDARSCFERKPYVKPEILSVQVNVEMMMAISNMNSDPPSPGTPWGNSDESLDEGNDSWGGGW